MTKKLSFAEDVRLNYNPEQPQKRFLAALPLAEAIGHLPLAVPWPIGLAPTPQPLTPAPLDTDDLSRFVGYDAIVITYTSAEAAAMASLLSPGYPLNVWYEYRNDIAAYIPLVTGKKAPFNATDKNDARYYQSLGLYIPCTIGKARVLLFKSGLHLDYDLEAVAPVIPINKMLTEMIQTVKPKLVITTGTGGGIGMAVQLGDVVIASHATFDCTGQFEKEPWARASYATWPVSSSALALITPALTSVNAAVIAAATPIPGRPVPTMWTGPNATITTTDTFAFDTSTNQPFGLQGLGLACDMGDAMVGQVMTQFPSIAWHAIRNASDPQMPYPAGMAYKEVDKTAGTIYGTYGPFTTAASLIASWAIIADTFK
jgi:nucleoside phosphorylase